ncbi:major facilitator superfamily domain-containing protein [Lipomyces kononenkoae]|uniref:Major facilitator superfamily domain-containing protein n=1 Tax=Lipomyces kononenkoae TaxID=34357 RepID=A0ACC3TAF4_LIPKO
MATSTPHQLGGENMELDTDTSDLHTAASDSDSNSRSNSMYSTGLQRTVTGRSGRQSHERYQPAMDTPALPENQKDEDLENDTVQKSQLEAAAAFASARRSRPAMPQRRSTFDAGDPVTIQRIQSARSIHSEILDYKVRKKIFELLPPFGAGKEYPPQPPGIENYIVEFDGADDPLHPQNWPVAKKLTMMAVLGFSTFVVAWGSSIFAPAVPFIRQEFHIGTVTAILAISLYVAGFASGPLIWGPLSELYGRRPPTVISTFICAIFHMAVARSADIASIMISRFFAGFFGASCLAVVPAAFSDIFGNKTRGTAITIFATMVFTGPLIAPVVGGFIVTSYLGWRWTSYLTSIMGFASFALVVIFMDETYPPQVLIQKARFLRRETDIWCILARQERSNFDLRELLEHNISRPMKMLFTEPILLLLTLYTAFVYGILYLLLEAYPIIFYQGYGMAYQISELPYLGLLVGQILGGVMVVSFEPRTYRRVVANGGRPIPELRLLPTMIGGVLFTIGIFWLTWTGAYHRHVHWIIPTISGIFTGMGLISIFISALNYIVESYLTFAASAVAANTFLRSGFGAGFPLFAGAMFNNLGIQWAGTLIGCIGFLLVPVPVLFYIYGKRLRMMSKYTPT